jgi:Family of unknown function (DUF5765)
MCWSAGASIAFGAAGVATAVYAEKKGVSRYVTVPVLFFSLMEFLQFAGYLYLNQCSLDANGLITQLSYIHIAIQPIFVNMLFLASVAPALRTRIQPYVFAAAAVTSALLLFKLVPFESQYLCVIGETLCARAWCTFQGGWHLAWNVPLYNFLPGDAMWYYTAGSMILPLFYGQWRNSILFLLSGPVLAYILTGGNPNEWPAVWCFYSVVLLIFAMKGVFPWFTMSDREKKRLFSR